MADSGRSCLLAATPGFYPVFPVDGKFLVNLGLLVESNINNDLTTKNDPTRTFTCIILSLMLIASSLDAGTG